MKLLKNKKILAIFFLILILGSVLVVPLSANAWNYYQTNNLNYDYRQGYIGHFSFQIMNQGNIRVDYREAVYGTSGFNELVNNITLSNIILGSNDTYFNVNVLDFGYYTDDVVSNTINLNVHYFEDLSDVTTMINNAFLYNGVVEYPLITSNMGNTGQMVTNGMTHAGYIVSFIQIENAQIGIRATADTVNYLTNTTDNRMATINYIYGATQNINFEYYPNDTNFDVGVCNIAFVYPIIMKDYYDYINNDIEIFDYYYNGVNNNGIKPLLNNAQRFVVDNYESTDFAKSFLGDTFQGIVNSLDSFYLIQGTGFAISIWDIFIAVVVILLFFAFLRIYLGG